VKLYECLPVRPDPQSLPNAASCARPQDSRSRNSLTPDPQPNRTVLAADPRSAAASAKCRISGVKPSATLSSQLRPRPIQNPHKRQVASVYEAHNTTPGFHAGNFSSCYGHRNRGLHTSAAPHSTAHPHDRKRPDCNPLSQPTTQLERSHVKPCPRLKTHQKHTAILNLCKKPPPPIPTASASTIAQPLLSPRKAPTSRPHLYQLASAQTGDFTRERSDLRQNTHTTRVRGRAILRTAHRFQS
jgi:hypothetical protein